MATMTVREGVRRKTSHGDALAPLVDAIGLDHVLFNSDWPHPEGLADPVEYAVYARDEVGLPDEDVAKIMGANMYALMGV